jgi:hypothetical protein
MGKKMTGEWRQLHVEKLYDLYASVLQTLLLCYISPDEVGEILQLLIKFWLENLYERDHTGKIPSGKRGRIREINHKIVLEEESRRTRAVLG